VLSNLARTYRHHLAKYFLFRLLKVLALAGYRNIHHIRSILSVPYTPGYRLVAWSNFAGEHLLKRVLFTPVQALDIPEPRFVNKGDLDKPDKIAILKIEMPKLEVVEISEAIVIGRTDFVLSDNAAILPDAFDSSLDTCPAEVFGVVSIKRDKKLMKLYLTQESKEIDSAITLLGQNSANYAHWLTEILPKLLVLDAYPEFREIPLLLDHGLHPNILESVRIFSASHREIISVKHWEPVKVKRLLCVSQPAYEPYIPHGLFDNESSQIVNTFSRPALSMLRNTAWRLTAEQTIPATKKLCISRSRTSGNVRGITNSDLVESFLKKEGFEVIEPASLTFSDQVIACKQARIIVAPIGAALANMIFSSPGCKIIVLAPYYEGASYYYYSNLAGILGHELYYVLGQQTSGGGHPMHRDYVIDLSELEAVLASLSDNGHLTRRYAATN
jgi:capsular polysaccharide biosynthesis protein